MPVEAWAVSEESGGPGKRQRRLSPRRRRGVARSPQIPADHSITIRMRTRPVCPPPLREQKEQQHVVQFVLVPPLASRDERTGRTSWPRCPSRGGPACTRDARSTPGIRERSRPRRAGASLPPDRVVMIGLSCSMIRTPRDPSFGAFDIHLQEVDRLRDEIVERKGRDDSPGPGLSRSSSFTRPPLEPTWVE